MQLRPMPGRSPIREQLDRLVDRGESAVEQSQADDAGARPGAHTRDSLLQRLRNLAPGHPSAVHPDGPVGNPESPPSRDRRRYAGRPESPSSPDLPRPLAQPEGTFW